MTSAQAVGRAVGTLMIAQAVGGYVTNFVLLASVAANYVIGARLEGRVDAGDEEAPRAT